MVFFSPFPFFRLPKVRVTASLFPFPLLPLPLPLPFPCANASCTAEAASTDTRGGPPVAAAADDVDARAALVRARHTADSAALCGLRRVVARADDTTTAAAAAATPRSACKCADARRERPQQCAPCDRNPASRTPPRTRPRAPAAPTATTAGRGPNSTQRKSAPAIPVHRQQP